MYIFLTGLCVVTCFVQNIFAKQYSLKCPNASFSFSAMKTFFALLFFLAISKGAQYGMEIVPYSLLFATVYAVATITSVLAIKTGSLAISALISSYSLVIPTFYGIVFLNEDLGILKGIGIMLLLLSIYLVRERREPDAQKKKASVKWVIYVSVCFIANGMCSVTQKMQQEKFGGKYDTSFMIIALTIATLALITATVILERKYLIDSIKKGALISFASGIANGATNLLVMVVVSVVAASVFFPVISAGGIVLTFIFSLFVYKEKFIPRQIAGVILGIGALVFLNI